MLYASVFTINTAQSKQEMLNETYLLSTVYGLILSLQFHPYMRNVIKEEMLY